MKTMLVSQHNDVERPNAIAKWGIKNGYNIKIVRPDKGDNLAQISPGDFSFLVIMGGDQSANDNTGWIKNERNLIKRANQAKKNILGICLGSQQISRTFGGQVVPGSKIEIGFLPVYKSSQNTLDNIPDKMTVLHWHQEDFTMPHNSKRLFKTNIDKNQGFSMFNNRVIGLQFHFEVDDKEVHQLTKMDKDFIAKSDAPSSCAQTAKQIDNQPVPKQNQQIMFSILNQMTNND